MANLTPRLLAAGLWAVILGPGAILPLPRAEAADIDEQIEEVYLTLEEALTEVFPDAEEITPSTHLLTEEQRERIEAYAKRPLVEPAVTVHTARSGGRVTGYAMVTEEIGMYKPITSLVAVDPKGRVREVVVMVYRESRGGEVRRKRFLHQYRGKTAQAPVRINRDIINVTGATLSVRSMNAQVRKALAVVRELFLR